MGLFEQPARGPRIVRGENDLLFGDDGQAYIDLFSAHGATWLGHANPAIVAAVARQLERLWLAGGLETDVLSGACAAVDELFPPSHRLVALYSTGMEGAEFALRVARGVTGRGGAVGFARGMHGKSLAAASLAWEDAQRPPVPALHRLPFLPVCGEEEILGRLERVLLSEPIGAVFVEPLHASGGGHAASPAFYREVARLCRAHGALLVWDEILTGFYRTGPTFVFSTLGLVPDIVLIGKAMGNGFPVSGVVLDRRHEVRPSMLPGSTYAGNPLAAAAVLATLTAMKAMDVPQRVARIERTVQEEFAGVAASGVGLRGKGALWVLELPPAADPERVVSSIYSAKVCIGWSGRYFRVIPPATIALDRLAAACAITARALLEARDHA